MASENSRRKHRIGDSQANEVEKPLVRFTAKLKMVAIRSGKSEDGRNGEKVALASRKVSEEG
jgi:hypothetical protein